MTQHLSPAACHYDSKRHQRGTQTTSQRYKPRFMTRWLRVLRIRVIASALLLDPLASVIDKEYIKIQRTLKVSRDNDYHRYRLHIVQTPKLISPAPSRCLHPNPPRRFPHSPPRHLLSSLHPNLSPTNNPNPHPSPSPNRNRNLGSTHCRRKSSLLPP